MKENRRTRKWIKVVKKVQRNFFLGRRCTISVVLPLGKHVVLSTLSQKRAAERKTQRERRGLWREVLTEVGRDGTNAQAEKLSKK